MQGVFKKFQGNFNLEALLACVQQEDQAALALDGAFRQLKMAADSHNVTDIITGVILSYMAFK
jgi:hypothetical protein